MDAELSAWFTREILAHEAALARFIKRSWLRPGDVPDLCHDVYVKVLESAERQRPSAPKAFLFATAKNLLIDRARRHRIVPIDVLQDKDQTNVLLDDLSPERTAGGLQYLLRLTQAFERLPDRCREVVWLRKIEDLSQKQIAERMNIAEATVEAHLVRGMRTLMQLCYGEEGEDSARSAKRVSGRENSHG